MIVYSVMISAISKWHKHEIGHSAKTSGNNCSMRLTKPKISPLINLTNIAILLRQISQNVKLLQHGIRFISKLR